MIDYLSNEYRNMVLKCVLESADSIQRHETELEKQHKNNNKRTDAETENKIKMKRKEIKSIVREKTKILPHTDDFLQCFFECLKDFYERLQNEHSLSKVKQYLLFPFFFFFCDI